MAEEQVWDQRQTLRPPPYRGAMARLLAGVEIGDDVIDALPDAVVSVCCKHRAASSVMDDVEQLPEPAWVDWALLRKGQELWREHLGRAFLALTAALLQGFTIARFADVLHNAGYAQSPLEAANRFQATAFFIHDWFHHPLDDPESFARRGIYTVRCLHSFARRHSKNLFSREAGEGIPLSQYDLGEVQLAFSAVCMAIMEVELGMGPLPHADREAMTHVWRFIGWHLGIQDRFNVCNSLEDLDACYKDFMEWTPQRLRSCRESTHALQSVTVQGFGRHFFIGQRYWEGFLAVLENFLGVAIPYVRVRPLPGIESVVRMRMRLVGKSDMVNASVNRYILLARETKRWKPKRADWFAVSVAPVVSAFNDIVLWRLLSLLAQATAAAGSLVAKPSHKAALAGFCSVMFSMLLLLRGRFKKRLL